jgi:asparagine synthase (glutamine-hydrolysing)
MDVRVVRAQPGSFTAPRLRPRGRIGGASLAIAPEAQAALAAALGPGSTLLVPVPGLVPGTELVVEFDSCEADGRALESSSDFAGRLTPRGLASIQGAFALAWFGQDGALHLARDPVGERSLYYARYRSERGDGWVFASTLRSLLAAGLVPREVDRVGVAEYLSYAYVPGSRTLVEGVRAVLPGEIVRLDRDAVTTTRYWAPPGENEVLPLSAEDQMRVDLRARLEAAVLRRLPPADEPVGASLSGGLDSSLVVALAQRLAGRPLHTFSISFGPDYPNELQFSSMVAEHCGTRHTIVELPPEAIVHHIDDVAAAFDRPIGDPLTVPNALLFREVTQHVGVLLNGEGGDPCFGGPKNLPMILAELYGDARNPPGDPFGRERTYLRAHQKCFDDLPALLDARSRAAISGDVLEQAVRPLFADERFRTFVNKLMMMNLILKAGHHILPKVDSLSGRFGVLGRSPLLDRRVVEAAFTMPPQLKLRGAEEKYLLKQAVADVLPEPIITRPKSGMMVPVESWFSGPLSGYARERLLDGLPRFDLFERRFLEDLVGVGLPNLRQRRGPKIWLLITLEAWLRRVLHGEASTLETNS